MSLRLRYICWRIAQGGAEVDLPSFLIGIVIGGAAVLILICVVIQALGTAFLEGERRCGH